MPIWSDERLDRARGSLKPDEVRGLTVPIYFLGHCFRVDGRLLFFVNTPWHEEKRKISGEFDPLLGSFCRGRIAFRT